MQVLKYLEPQHIEIVEIPRPQIADGEVLVQTRACGICATDVKTFMRGHPLIRPGTVLGHELAGVIVESRASEWRVGERVAVAPYVPCGECEFCRRRQFTLCQDLWNASIEPGGFSEFVRVPRRLVQMGMVRVPPTLDLTTATLAEPLACCYHGLDALQIARGDSLLILGDGPMGLMQASIARALGASPIVLGGITPERLAIGARYADCVVNVSTESLPDAIKRVSAGAGMDKVIVSVGLPQVAEQALAFVKRGGAINLFAGLPRGSQITLDPNRIHYDEITLLGTFGLAPHHFARAVDALVRGDLDVRALITRTVTLAETANAFADSAAYRGIKTVVQFE